MASVGYLYVTSNEVNSSLYVGQSSRLSERDLTEYLGSGDHLRSAITEMGKHRFTKRVVGYFGDHVELDYAEIVLIAKLRAEGVPLYNAGVGGPRIQASFLASMQKKFAATPSSPIHWHQTLLRKKRAVKRLLANSPSASTDDFYLEYRKQLRATQDLTKTCSKCGSITNELCTTKTGNPARNHAGR